LRRDDASDWPSVNRDLSLARTISANLLVVGTERLVVNLVSLLVSGSKPEAVFRCRDGLQLPPPAARVGPMVFRDVDALTLEEQARLFEWLGLPKNRGQVVSTASLPLLPLVDAGAFDAALYYRLNTVYIELSD
jgi:hypothetical protein